MSQTVLRHRMTLLDELRQIVSAMRNMSVVAIQRLGKAAQVEQEAEHLLAQALADIDSVWSPSAGPDVFLVIGSEHGFCGGFNDKLADFLKRQVATLPMARCYAAGARVLPLLRDALPQLQVLEGCADMEDAADTVLGWVNGIWLKGEALSSFTVIYHAEAGVTAHRVLPMSSLPPKSKGASPLRYLAKTNLEAELTSEWLRLVLLGALTQSLTIEHHWRINQMQQADKYLDDMGNRLRGRMQRQRQNEITTELENLMNALVTTHNG